MEKKSVFKKIKNIAIQIIIGGSVGYIVFHLLPSLGFPRLSLPRGSLISFIVCFVLQIAIHELGHLMAGKISGYKLLWIGIFNTTFVKKGRKWIRIKINVEGILGHCLMSPPEMKNGKFPFVFYTLGGSLMNFLVSAISLALYFIFFPTYWIFVTFAGVGIFLGIINIIPLNIGGIANDGYDVLKRLKSDAERRSFWHLCRFYEDMIIKDVRPRDMSDEQLALLSSKENQDNDLDVVVEIFRLNRLCDRHEFEKAKILTEKLLNTSDDMIALVKNDLICALLFLELIGECRKEEVERLYTKELKDYIKTTSSYPSRQLLLYAYAKLFLQDDTEATKALEKFNKVALSYPFGGEVEGDRELIELVDKLAIEKKNFQ